MKHLHPSTHSINLRLMNLVSIIRMNCLTDKATSYKGSYLLNKPYISVAKNNGASNLLDLSSGCFNLCGSS